MAGCTPKKGSVAEPGLAGHTPGRGASTWAPVSVCQYVSTMGHLSPPTTCTMQHPLACLVALLHVDRLLNGQTACIICGESLPHGLFDSNAATSACLLEAPTVCHIHDHNMHAAHLAPLPTDASLYHASWAECLSASTALVQLSCALQKFSRVFNMHQEVARNHHSAVSTQER